MHKLTYLGITNQRETTLCWSKSTGKPLCNAIVWDDVRTNGVVRNFEKKLEDEGIEIDEDEAPVTPNGNADGLGDGVADGVEMGSGRKGTAISEVGEVEDPGVVGLLGKAMEGLGLAGRGKEMGGKKRRKGTDGLVDM